MTVMVTAPASSANLGSGFDCLAVALEIRCRVTARMAGDWSVRHRGSAPDPSDDVVLEAARAVAGTAGALAIEVSSDIPIGRGLGSSAEAAAAGAAAAMLALGGRIDRRALFDLVTGMEGHPDNAAAAVFGGLNLVSPAGHAVALPWSDRVAALVAVPGSRLSTVAARGAVPTTFERPIVVRSLSRVAALTAGLVLGDVELLAEARGDELHEPSRAGLHPEPARLISAAHAAGAAFAAWSGAGPSVLAVASADEAAAVADRWRSAAGDGVEVLLPGIAVDGVSPA